jgi:Na+-transporting NADH:ubiquinone oxidoreductase subunit A
LNAILIYINGLNPQINLILQLKINNLSKIMPETVKIRKGMNIRLQGGADKILIKPEPATYYALKPTDFHGIAPKLMVKNGDRVKAGTPVFFDKNQPRVFFCSPVSGVVLSVDRGEKRVVRDVVIEADHTIQFEEFATGNPLEITPDAFKELLLRSGCWPAIRQRPYGIIANPADSPKAIFISAFDTAPLAPDYDFLMRGMEKEFQAGINALARLTKGTVHLNIAADTPATSFFTRTENALITRFKGRHPAGNVGVQIHHLNPVNKGEVVWVINPQDVVIIGRLLLTGRYDATKVVVLAGSEVINPRYYQIISGTSLTNLLTANTRTNHLRYISGNVLSGTQIDEKGFIGYYDSQVTVIPEGDHFDFLGWARPGINKFSLSRAFPSWLQPRRKYLLDTNLNGGERAFVMTGIYEKLLPMDIFPMQLLKAILAGDIDLMEKLGIYEVVEEDFSLCEYACPSKIEIQSIIRTGLNLMKKEMS